MSISKSIIINFFLLIFSIYFIFFGKRLPLTQGYIVNEREIYTMGLEQSLSSRFMEIKYPWYIEGTKYKKLENCLEYPKFIITNSISKAKCNEQGFGLGYFSVGAGTDVSVIDEQGLTDKYIARQSRKKNFRPGHEREVGLDYLIQRGVLFCSLDSKSYDEIMNTQYGIIINLDPDFLFRLGPEIYKEKIIKLKALYKQASEQKTKQDRRLLEKLRTLEDRYNIKIVELPSEVEKSFTAFSSCWQ